MKNIITINIIGAALACAAILPLTTASSQAQEVSCREIYQAADESTEKLQELLESGAVINSADSGGETALMLAAENKNKHATQRLIDNGADINARNEEGETALMIAAENGASDVVCTLLDEEADPNIRDNDGETALQKASDAGHADIAGLIGRAGGQ
jgi:ankyrin repeat protein